jgi:hypothetical protein
MHIHPTSGEEQFCPCGAVISEDDRNLLCPKCRSRARWQRRTEGRRRHPRREVRMFTAARAAGSWS